MKDSHLIELTEFTDPYCTWCWGSEPILRKIEEVYGDQVKISYTMGGLVADMSTFHDSVNRIGGSNWYGQVAAHWVEASNRHGMPVDEQIFFDLKDSRFSTHPACIAYKSAQFQDEELANRFLRKMREGVAAERKDIQRLDVQRSLAGETGLEADKFMADIESGKAGKAFEKDLQECRRRGIRGFPSFLVRGRRNNEELLLRGFRLFDEFADVFREAGGGAVKTSFPSASKDSILAFVRKYDKVAPQEISEVFGLGKEDVDGHLTSLMSDGSLRKTEAGNGFFKSQK